MLSSAVAIIIIMLDHVHHIILWVCEHHMQLGYLDNSELKGGLVHEISVSV